MLRMRTMASCLPLFSTFPAPTTYADIDDNEEPYLCFCQQLPELCGVMVPWLGSALPLRLFSTCQYKPLLAEATSLLTSQPAATATAALPMAHLQSPATAQASSVLRRWGTRTHADAALPAPQRFAKSSSPYLPSVPGVSGNGRSSALDLIDLLAHRLLISDHALAAERRHVHDLCAETSACRKYTALKRCPPDGVGLLIACARTDDAPKAAEAATRSPAGREH